MTNHSDSKHDSMRAEPDALTAVAKKVGTAVGTVVSLVSGKSKSETSKSGASKKDRKGTKSRQKSSTRMTDIAPRNNKPGAAKPSKHRSKKQPASTATEHSPLKRHRIKRK